MSNHKNLLCVHNFFNQSIVVFQIKLKNAVLKIGKWFQIHYLTVASL